MDATPHVEPLRPERGVSPRAPSRAQPPSAAAARQQIYLTLDELRARLEELQEYVHSRFGTIDDPLHVREKIAARPMRACGVALLAGVACGVLRAHKLPWLVVRKAAAVSSGVARGATATFGSTIASDLVSRVMSPRCRASGE